MITREDAVRLADEWFGGGKDEESVRHIGIREFGTGYVVWVIDPPPEDLSTPPPSPGSAAGVIDKTTGQCTLMPSLPPDEIISRYQASCQEMITRAQAERIANKIIAGRDEFELIEFDQGWLIITATDKARTHRGAASSVIERSGRVMRFASSVPPDRILNEYDKVVHDGSPLRDIRAPGRRYTRLPLSIVIYIAACLLLAASVALWAVGDLDWQSLPGPAVVLVSVGFLLLRMHRQ